MPGRLVAEVIDTVHGRGAAGMLVDLFRVLHGVGDRRHVRTVETTAASGGIVPLLEGEGFAPATYELLFHVGRYFKAARPAAGDAPFFDVVPVRFTVTDAAQTYRVSLLASPWSYTAHATTGQPG